MVACFHQGLITDNVPALKQVLLPGTESSKRRRSGVSLMSIHLDKRCPREFKQIRDYQGGISHACRYKFWTTYESCVTCITATFLLHGLALTRSLASWLPRAGQDCRTYLKRITLAAARAYLVSPARREDIMRLTSR